MAKTHSTKRAMLGSAISLLLCFAMLLGTTFAWFTDNVTSTNNIIKSGNLDVELYYQMEEWDDTKWEKVESSTNVFKQDTLWEPGHTEVVKLKVVNEGSLALKYQLGVNVASETGSTNVDGKEFKLSDYIKYAVVEGVQTYSSSASAAAAVDATATSLNKAYTSATTQLLPLTSTNTDNADIVTMVVYMPTSVGNEANYSKGEAAPVINLGINLFATQKDYEEDSFGKDYDEDAMFGVGSGLYIDETDGSLVALSMEGLSSAAAAASADEKITSVKYNGETIPVVRDSAALDTAIDADNDVVVIANGNYTVDKAKNTNVTIVGNGENTKLSIEAEGEYNTDYGFDGSTVVFENLTFNVDGYLNGYARMNATYNNCIINGTYTLNGKAVFNNCKFNKTGDDYCVWTWGAPTAEFNNCTFNTDGKAILMYGGANTVLKLTGCTFNDSGVISNKAAIEVGSDWATDKKEIIISNCTVNGFDVTKQHATLTWGGSNLGTNVWGNKNLLPADRLNVVIDGVDVH